jgi:type IV pilus assembly protein PilY1
LSFTFIATRRRHVNPLHRPAGARHAAVALAAAVGLLFSIASQATDVATRPLQGASLVEPNIVFGIDDSGSMDAEILLNTNSGMLWWHKDLGSGWNAVNNTAQDSAGSITEQMRKLFPQLGTRPDLGIEPANNVRAHAAPPIKELAWLRSSSFNLLYYDPMVTYAPWATAEHDLAIRTYSDAVPHAAKTHPGFFAPTTQITTVDLTVDHPADTDPQHHFHFYRGMTIPAGAKKRQGTAWVTVGGPNPNPVDEPVTTNEVDVAMPYFPATYWHRVTSCLATDVCVAAPDGNGMLKRYEIRDNGTNFPSGRTYAAEMQNFANWWQYYRKRKLMLAAAMGRVLEGLGSGVRLGTTYFNDTNPPPIAMLSSGGNNPAKALRQIAGSFYTRSTNQGTPTSRTLNFIGDQFNDNPSLIQYACQRNNAFIVTDGFPNASVAGRDYDRSQYAAAPPHSPTSKGTVADHALYHYTKRLRENAFPSGLVPKGDEAEPNADLNTDLHMNTYVVSLGARGELWPDQANPVSGLPINPIGWIAPPNDSRASLDDLWHATINGRGRMLLANSAEQMSEAVSKVLYDIVAQVGAQGGASVSSVNLASDAFALLSSFRSGRWSGDVTKNAVDPATGAVSPTAQWSLAAQLDALPSHTSRVLFTKDAVFDATGVGSFFSNDPTAATRIVNHLRGDRSAEGFTTTSLRPRGSRLGAIASSAPVLNNAKSVAFVAANDGFLHAVDVATGNELWAYAPRSALAAMGQSTQRNWGFRTLHDGKPTVARVTAASGEMLFGGLGSGGNGWYGIDISNAIGALPAATRATTVKWELPGANNATLQQQMGLAVGKPLLAKTQHFGEVLLLTSGYNASANDGRGRVFVVNPVDGAVLQTLTTPQVDGVTTGDPGLAHINTFREVDGSVRYVYGGDERGNLWRFDLGGTNTPPSVNRLARLTDGSNPQPITVKPALVGYQGQRIVMVGTGRALGQSDFTSGQDRTQTFYAIKDDGSEVAPRGGNLAVQTMLASADGTRNLSNPVTVNWSQQHGWLVDLPQGERANLDPQVGIAAVSFFTNQPGNDACSMQSYRYAFNIASAGAVPPAGADASYNTVGWAASAQGTVGSSVVGMQGGGTAVVATDGTGATTTKPLEPPGAATPRKAGWRQVLK